MGFVEYSEHIHENSTGAAVIPLKPIREAVEESLKICSEHKLDTVYVYDPKNIYDFDAEVKKK